MKVRKLLSVVLSLALIISCFSSLSVLNVSAHQNFSDKADFDALENTYPIYTSKGMFAANKDEHRVLDVAASPGGRQGQSIKSTYKYGSTKPYELGYYPQDPTAITTDSIYLKSSVYIEDNCYLGFKTRPSQTYALLFSPETNKISVCGVNSDKNWSTNKWYDIELKWNMNTGYFEVKILEDGELFFEKASESSYKELQDVTRFEMYHLWYPDRLKEKFGSEETVVYWDNFEIKTINELKPATVESGKIKMDFNDLTGQTLGNTKPNMGESSVGYWIGSTPAYTVIEKAEGYDGTAAMAFVPPVYDNISVVQGNSEEYVYLTFGAANVCNNAVNISTKFKYNDANGSTGLLNLYDTNKNTAIATFYGNVTFFGYTIPGNWRLDPNSWYDLDIKFDLKTKYYDVSLKNLTYPDDPAKSVYISGFTSTDYFGTDGANILGLYASRSNDKFISKRMELIIDDFYFGDILNEEEPTVAIADISAANGADNSFKLPFVSYNYGHNISSALNITGNASALKLGNDTVDISALEAGEYPLNIKLLNEATPTAEVTIAGTDYPVTLSSLPDSIGITAASGDANSVSLNNISYVAIPDFCVTSETAINNLSPNSDITISFSDVLADSVTANNFTVYAPNGKLDNTVLVENVAVEFSQDRKNVSLKFDKEEMSHYHISFNAANRFGQTISGVVEVDTAMAPAISDISLTSDGNTVTAVFTSTAKAGTVFYAIALYCDDELAELVPSTITLSEADVNKEYTVSITAPSDGLTYKAKAFRWDAETISPFENAKAPEMTVTTVKNN